VDRQRKVKIQENAVGAEPCDPVARSSGREPRKRTRDTHSTSTVTVSLEQHQAIVHHGTANEVVVAGALNSEMCDENVRF